MAWGRATVLCVRLVLLSLVLYAVAFIFLVATAPLPGDIDPAPQDRTLSLGPHMRSSKFLNVGRLNNQLLVAIEAAHLARMHRRSLVLPDVDLRGDSVNNRRSIIAAHDMFDLCRHDAGDYVCIDARTPPTPGTPPPYVVESSCSVRGFRIEEPTTSVRLATIDNLTMSLDQHVWINPDTNWPYFYHMLSMCALLECREIPAAANALGEPPAVSDVIDTFLPQRMLENSVGVHYRAGDISLLCKLAILVPSYSCAMGTAELVTSIDAVRQPGEYIYISTNARPTSTVMMELREHYGDSIVTLPANPLHPEWYPSLDQAALVRCRTVLLNYYSTFSAVTLFKRGYRSYNYIQTITPFAGGYVRVATPIAVALYAVASFACGLAVMGAYLLLVAWVWIYARLSGRVHHRGHLGSMRWWGASLVCSWGVGALALLLCNILVRHVVAFDTVYAIYWFFAEPFACRYSTMSHCTPMPWHLPLIVFFIITSVLGFVFVLAATAVMLVVAANTEHRRAR